MIARKLRIEARGVSAHKNFRPLLPACCCWLGTSSGRRGDAKCPAYKRPYLLGATTAGAQAGGDYSRVFLAADGTKRYPRMRRRGGCWDAGMPGWQLGFQMIGQSGNDHHHRRLKLTSSGSTGWIGWMDYLPPEHVHASRWLSAARKPGRENRDCCDFSCFSHRLLVLHE
jgi:hypothetical protein